MSSNLLVTRPARCTGLHWDITSAARVSNQDMMAESLEVDFILRSTWCLSVLSCATHDLTARSAAPLALESLTGEFGITASACG